MIAVHAVTKAYGRSEALRGVDLRVDAGEVVAVIGPSGSGKSTLLRCINGLESITTGSICINGETLVCRGAADAADSSMDARTLRRTRANLGMVFQRYNLFAHMTALQNVCEAQVHVLGRSADEATVRANDLLSSVNLRHRAHHYPEQLSGGEQQRVAIARALAMDPQAMLFDEATSALDPETVGDVLQVMRGLAAQGMTMLVVTHEVRFAREVADSVIVMERGQIIDRGSADQVLENPTNPRTREFLRRVLSH